MVWEKDTKACTTRARAITTKERIFLWTLPQLQASLPLPRLRHHQYPPHQRHHQYPQRLRHHRYPQHLRRLRPRRILRRVRIPVRQAVPASTALLSQLDAALGAYAAVSLRFLIAIVFACVLNNARRTVHLVLFLSVTHIVEPCYTCLFT